MKSLKTFIVEDEPLVLQSMIALLEKYCPEVEIVGSAGELKEALHLIPQHQPELLILDIQLKEGTSFELLKNLPTLNFEVIFVTAFSQYAIKAIKFNALDYLLKPVDVDELKEAVQRVGKKKNIKQVNQPLKQFLMNNNTPSIDKRITLPTSDAIEFVKVKDIIRCKADGAYTVFFTLQKKITVSRNIKVYEELLADFSFFRPHQSHLINKDHISKYVKVDGGFLEMADGEKIPVSKHKRSTFLTWLASS